jgi:hypothetical protein
MPPVDFLNIPFFVALALFFLFLGLLIASAKKKRSRLVKLFGLFAVFSILAALALIYLSFHEVKRQSYELARASLASSQYFDALLSFERAGNYKDAKIAAETLKALLNPTNDLPALIKKVRDSQKDLESFSRLELARWLAKKIVREGQPKDVLSFLADWPISVAEVNKLLEGEEEPWGVPDPKGGEWLRSVADPDPNSDSEKTVVYYVKEGSDDRVVYFGLMADLPARNLPAPGDSVARAIVITERRRRLITKPGEPPEESLEVEVSINSSSDMRIIWRIGRVFYPKSASSIWSARQSIYELVDKAMDKLLAFRYE